MIMVMVLWCGVGIADENVRLICKRVSDNETFEYIFNVKDGEKKLFDHYYNDEGIYWITNYNEKVEVATHATSRISRTTGKMTINYYKLNDEQKMKLDSDMAVSLQKYQGGRVEKNLGLDKNLNTFAYAYYKSFQQYEIVHTLLLDCEKTEKKF